jgi:hypothetical protein
MLPVTAVALCASASCSASYPSAPATAQLTSLQVQYAVPTPDPRVGRAVPFVAYAVDSDGVWTDVTAQTAWRVGDSSVVRVSSGSTMLAIGSGSTDVVGSYGGQVASVPILVRPEPGTPRLEFTNLSGPVTLDRAGGVSLSQEPATGGFATSLATWTSSNPAIVTVSVINSASARLSPHGTGTARVTATLGGLSSSMSVSVGPRQ